MITSYIRNTKRNIKHKLVSNEEIKNSSLYLNDVYDKEDDNIVTQQSQIKTTETKQFNKITIIRRSQRTKKNTIFYGINN